MIRLTFISLYFAPARSYGGPVASATALVKALTSRDFRVDVLTTDADGDERVSPITIPNARIAYCRRVVGEFFAPALLFRAALSVPSTAATYVWGLFVWPLPIVILLARIFKRPLVISPRGMLHDQALASKSGKKRLFLRLLMLCGIRRAAVFHATSDEEARITESVFGQARVFVIPNGVDLPDIVRDDHAPRYILYLGRIHPHKQIELLIDAFAIAVRGLPQDARLIIAGSGRPEYVETLKDRALRLGVSNRTDFCGHVDGDDKSSLLASATVLAVASKSENFAISVAEALAHSTPVIATRTIPWAELVDKKCGWFVDDTPPALATAFVDAFEISEADRRAMGARAREWMKTSYSWTSVGARFATVMNTLIQERL